MAQYEVVAETLGANPTYSKGDVIEDSGELKPPFDFGWLVRSGAIRRLDEGADAPRREPSPRDVPPAAAGPDMVVPPGETAPAGPPAAPPAATDPLAFLTDEQRAALNGAGYGSVKAIRAATDDELDAVPGIGEATVGKLRDATRE